MASHSSYIRRLLAATLLKENKPQQALEVLKPLSDASSDDTGLLALFAEAYYLKGDIAKAKSYFEIAARKNPENLKVRAGLGMARIATGETERAIADLESAIADAGALAGVEPVHVRRICGGQASQLQGGVVPERRR